MSFGIKRKISKIGQRKYDYVYRCHVEGSKLLLISVTNLFKFLWLANKEDLYKQRTVEI